MAAAVAQPAYGLYSSDPAAFQTAFQEFLKAQDNKAAALVPGAAPAKPFKRCNAFLNSTTLHA